MLGTAQQLDEHPRSAGIDGILRQLAKNIENRRYRFLSVGMPGYQGLRGGQVALEDRPEQCRLVVEVVEDAGRTDAYGCCDLRHARALIALCCEQPARLGCDLLPLLRDPLLIRSPRHTNPIIV